MGTYVGSRGVKKVFPVSSHIAATMAGGAADCAYWIRRVSGMARILGRRFDATLHAGAVARMLAASLKGYKGTGLSVGAMVAGWDRREGPTLYYVDSEGACIQGNLFCVGSGAQFAYAVLDSANDRLGREARAGAGGGCVRTGQAFFPAGSGYRSAGSETRHL